MKGGPRQCNASCGRVQDEPGHGETSQGKARRGEATVHVGSDAFEKILRGCQQGRPREDGNLMNNHTWMPAPAQYMVYLLEKTRSRPPR
jgi:hypothetical protein